MKKIWLAALTITAAAGSVDAAVYRYDYVGKAIVCGLSCSDSNPIGEWVEIDGEYIFEGSYDQFVAGQIKGHFTIDESLLPGKTLANSSLHVETLSNGEYESGIRRVDYQVISEGVTYAGGGRGDNFDYAASIGLIDYDFEFLNPSGWLQKILSVQFDADRNVTFWMNMVNESKYNQVRDEFQWESIVESLGGTSPRWGFDDYLPSQAISSGPGRWTVTRLDVEPAPAPVPLPAAGFMLMAALSTLGAASASRVRRK